VSSRNPGPKPLEGLRGVIMCLGEELPQSEAKRARGQAIALQRPYMKQYNHKQIEKKWQQVWAKKALYKTPEKISGKKNFYLLVEFPYPSGNLHVGHWYAFAIPDILARICE
jgi:arginyl-tRNA synthetase